MHSNPSGQYVKFAFITISLFKLASCTAPESDSALNPEANEGPEVHDTRNSQEESPEAFADQPAGETSEILGSYLVIADYDNARTRCEFSEDNNQYEIKCSIIAVQENGLEFVATEVAKGLNITWNNPNLINGEVAGLNCQKSQDQLNFQCQLQLVSDEARLEVSTRFENANQQSRSEAQNIYLPWAVETIGGSPSGLGIRYANSAQSLVNKAGRPISPSAKPEDEALLQVKKLGLQRYPTSPFSFQFRNGAAFTRQVYEMGSLYDPLWSTKEHLWGAGQSVCHIGDDYFVLSNSYIFRFSAKDPAAGIEIWAGSPQKQFQSDYSHRLRTNLRNSSFNSIITCGKDAVHYAEITFIHDTAPAVHVHRILSFHTNGRVTPLYVPDSPFLLQSPENLESFALDVNGELSFIDLHEGNKTLFRIADGTSKMIANLAALNHSIAIDNYDLVLRSSISSDGTYYIAQSLVHKSSFDELYCNLLGVTASGTIRILGDADSCGDTALDSEQNQLAFPALESIFKLTVANEYLAVGTKTKVTEVKLATMEAEARAMPPISGDIAVHYATIMSNSSSNTYSESDIYRQSALFYHEGTELAYVNEYGIFFPSDSSYQRKIGLDPFLTAKQRSPEELMTSLFHVDSSGNFFNFADSIILKRDRTGTISRHFGRSIPGHKTELEYKGDLTPYFRAMIQLADGSTIYSADIHDDSGFVTGRMFRVDKDGNETTIFEDTRPNLMPIDFVMDGSGTLFSLIHEPSSWTYRLQEHDPITYDRIRYVFLPDFFVLGIGSHEGRVYYSSLYEIRRINSDGNVVTVAGNQYAPLTDSRGDGGDAGAALLNYPFSFDFDSLGNLYISSVDRVRFVDHRNNKISTLLGDNAQANECGLGTIRSDQSSTGTPTDLKSSLSFFCTGTPSGMGVYDSCSQPKGQVEIYFSTVYSYNESAVQKVTRPCNTP
ncbi:MAG: hypothetical protein HRU19_29625 [Pseudobacteriovorax sp.]|nr:hypothetical protein [Pseudobacteriovorax sp.]